LSFTLSNRFGGGPLSVCIAGHPYAAGRNEGRRIVRILGAVSRTGAMTKIK
jgi:hypothetical protein